MKKFFIIACVLGLVNYSTEDCSASNMRKKNASNVCQLENDFNLRELERHYSYHQGQAWHWPQTLYSTNVIVSKMLKKDMKSFSNVDKVAIWAFLENGFSLRHFMGSQYYDKTIHFCSVVNLFKLSVKLFGRIEGISANGSAIIEEYSSIVSGFNDSSESVEKVLSSDFSNIQSSVADVLYRNISWIF